jgi:hypothetical protein
MGFETARDHDQQLIDSKLRHSVANRLELAACSGIVRRWPQLRLRVTNYGPSGPKLKTANSGVIGVAVRRPGVPRQAVGTV